MASLSINTVLITSGAGFLIENLDQYVVLHFFLFPAHFLLLFLARTLTLTSTSLASNMYARTIIEPFNTIQLDPNS